LPDWPTPSLWRVVLLENPWPLILVLAPVLAVLAWLWLQRRTRSLGLAAVAVLLMGAGAWASATLVTTPREQLRAATVGLVEAALHRPAALRTLVPEPCVLTDADGQVHISGPAAFVAIAERAHRKYKIDGQASAVNRLDARRLGGDRGQSFCAVTAMVSWQGIARPVPTEWLLTWQMPANGPPRLVEARCLRIAGERATAAMFP
jgi:hypothetical protein